MNPVLMYYLMNKKKKDSTDNGTVVDLYKSIHNHYIDSIKTICDSFEKENDLNKILIYRFLDINPLFIHHISSEDNNFTGIFLSNIFFKTNINNLLISYLLNQRKKENKQETETENISKDSKE